MQKENKKGWLKEDSHLPNPEGVKENKFADSICRELTVLNNEYRKIKKVLSSENTILFLRSPDIKKELIKAKIEVLNKILLHLP